MIIPDRVVERALNLMDLTTSGCYVSRYSVGSHGYAQIGWYDGTRTINTLAHRVAWIANNGPIPEDMTIDHLCRNRKCVNVEHMRLLNNYENARRNTGRDWPLGQCINGHDNSNLYVECADGRLRCRLCKIEYGRRYRAKRKARLAS